MVEQHHYMSSGLPHPGDLAGHHSLPDDRPSAPPTTSTYPDIAPYSAVSSFNLPTQCDSSLLTPISTGGSPPLHQARKLARQYPAPPSTPYSQLPTPPGSSKMYQWNNQFDMNGHVSQAGSPMNTQAPVAPEFYMSDERRTPGPPEPYLGSFGVSEGPDTQPIHHTGPPYYLDVSMENHTSIMMREMDPHHREMARHAPPPPAPLLSQPHPAHYRPTQRPSMDHHGHGNAGRRSQTDSPRRRPTRGNTRVKKSRASKRQPALRNHALDPADDYKNCFGQEVPPTLKPSCPDEELCIFDSRWAHRHHRGQDMWDNIQSDFVRRFNKDHGKEMLQMKFKRARAKYIQWLEKDQNDLIRQAWKLVEDERYPTMLKRFYELGGSRNMYLSPSDMELKAVELKLEEALYITVGEVKSRRRHKSVVKKRSGARGEPGGEQPVSDELLSVGSRSTHNEDDVINQVYGRRDARWDEDSSTNSEMTDASMWDSRAPMKMEPGVMVPSGEHMAQQACEQMLKVHSNSNLNGHAAGGPPAQQLYHHPKGA